MLTTSYCYSQEISKVINGSDTSGLIPIRSAESINDNYASWDECEETNDSLRGVIVAHRNTENTQLILIKYLTSELNDQQGINNNQLQAISVQGKDLTSCQTKYIRMLHWKNVEVVGVIIVAGVFIWQMKK